MATYNQNDYNILAGYNTDWRYTIRTVGCLITAFANSLQWIGIDTDPVALNEAMKAHNCFQEGGAFYIPETINRIYPDLTEENYEGYPQAIVQEALTNPNKIVILGVDFNKITEQIDWHFVSLYSATQILDPNGGVIRPLGFYPIKNVKIIIRKETDTMSKEDKQQLHNWRVAKETALNDPRLASLGEDEKSALGSWDGDDNEASNMLYLGLRIVELRQIIADYQKKLDEVTQEDIKEREEVEKLQAELLKHMEQPQEPVKTVRQPLPMWTRLGFDLSRKASYYSSIVFAGAGVGDLIATVVQDVALKGDFSAEAITRAGVLLGLAIIAQIAGQIQSLAKDYRVKLEKTTL